MPIPKDILSEANRLHNHLSVIHNNWDGKNCIEQMRRQNFQWRQLEWIGFYGEMVARDILVKLCEIPGKKYGNVIFDAFSLINWDIKVHPNSQSSAILNDKEVMDLSIEKYGFHGLIMICVDCEYDDDAGSFKRWHDELKGGVSNYEVDRVARGAKSRRRKTSAFVTNISMVVFDENNLSQLGSAQKNWRNSDGSARREKYQISHDLIGVLELNKYFN